MKLKNVVSITTQSKNSHIYINNQFGVMSIDIVKISGLKYMHVWTIVNNKSRKLYGLKNRLDME